MPLSGFIDTYKLYHHRYFSFNGWLLSDKLFLPLLPVFLQQREPGGLHNKEAEHLSHSLPAAQPDQGLGWWFYSVLRPGQALPFPRGQSQSMPFRHTRLLALTLICVFLTHIHTDVHFCAFMVGFWVWCWNIHLTFLPPHGCISPAVLQLQRVADPAGLLCVPPHQQHREAGSDAAHPAHFPPAGRVASGGPVWQRRPAGQSQKLVSPLPAPLK